MSGDLFYPQVTHQIGGNTSGATALISTGTLFLAGGDNITLSQNGNSITISGASGGEGAGITNIRLSAGTTSNLLSAITFSDSNGISFGINASTITATVKTDYLTTAMLSNAATLSNIRVSGGTTSNLLSAITFADSNGVSFGLNAGTMTMTVKTDYLTSQLTQFLAVTLAGNTAGTTTFHATNNASLFLNGGDNITLSGNGSTITIVGGAGGGGSQSLGMHTSTAGGVTGGTSGFASGSAIVYNVYAGSNITLSQSVNGASGSLTIYGSTNGLMSFYENRPLQGGASALLGLSGSTIGVAPFILPHPISIGHLRLLMSISHVTTASAGTSNNVTFSNRRFQSHGYVVYTQGVGASSRSIQSIFSTSTGWTMNTVILGGTNGSQYTVSYDLTYPNGGGGTSEFHTSYGVSSSAYNISSENLTAFTGIRFMDIPFATSLSAGAYWIGMGRSTTTSTAGLSGPVNASFGFSNYLISQIAQSIGMLGSATVSTILARPFDGIWTTNAFNMTTASIAQSNMSAPANNPSLYFQMIRQA